MNIDSEHHAEAMDWETSVFSLVVYFLQIHDDVHCMKSIKPAAELIFFINISFVKVIADNSKAKSRVDLTSNGQSRLNLSVCSRECRSSTDKDTLESGTSVPPSDNDAFKCRSEKYVPCGTWAKREGTNDRRGDAQQLTTIESQIERQKTCNHEALWLEAVH